MGYLSHTQHVYKIVIFLRHQHFSIPSVIQIIEIGLFQNMQCKEYQHFDNLIKTNLNQEMNGEIIEVTKVEKNKLLFISYC